MAPVVGAATAGLTHAAITENKRLGDVLAFIQAQQEQDTPKARRAGKQRTRYEPKGTVGPGRTPLLVKARHARAEARSD